MNMMRLKAPDPTTASVSVEGQNYDVVHGVVEVPAFHVKHLLVQGFKALERDDADRSRRDPEAAAARATSERPAEVRSEAPVYANDGLEGVSFDDLGKMLADAGVEAAAFKSKTARREALAVARAQRAEAERAEAEKKAAEQKPAAEKDPLS